MARPNPYIVKGQPGSKQWWDLFANPALTKAKRSPNGQLYSISYDLVETGIFYNKDIFRKCGMSVPDGWQGPSDWQEFLDIQRRIELFLGDGVSHEDLYEGDDQRRLQDVTEETRRRLFLL